jgi:phosphohistidine phosphatase
VNWLPQPLAEEAQNPLLIARPTDGCGRKVDALVGPVALDDSAEFTEGSFGPFQRGRADARAVGSRCQPDCGASLFQDLEARLGMEVRDDEPACVGSDVEHGHGAPVVFLNLFSHFRSQTKAIRRKKPVQLIIVRHGPAGTPLQDAELDEARTLTKKGRKQTKAAMKGIVGLTPHIQRVVTSPLARASETADLLAKAGKTQVAIDERLAPGGTVDELIEELTGQGDSAVFALVGHDPQVSNLVVSLSTGQKVARRQFVGLDKGGAAGLNYEDGRWKLEWLCTRKALAEGTA